MKDDASGAVLKSQQACLESGYIKLAIIQALVSDILWCTALEVLPKLMTDSSTSLDMKEMIHTLNELKISHTLAREFLMGELVNSFHPEARLSQQLSTARSGR